MGMPDTFVSTLLILCLYGFFKELKPSEPYLTEYLTGEQYKNLSQEAVYQRVRINDHMSARLFFILVAISIKVHFLLSFHFDANPSAK